MIEFITKIDRLTERLQRGITQCNHIEQRACLVEKRLLTLNESIQTLARIIELRLFILNSSEKEKLTWLKLCNDEKVDLTNTITKQFFYRLELYLRRSIIDNNEKQAYIQAFFLLQSPSIVLSGFY